MHIHMHTHAHCISDAHANAHADARRQGIVWNWEPCLPPNFRGASARPTHKLGVASPNFGEGRRTTFLEVRGANDRHVARRAARATQASHVARAMLSTHNHNSNAYMRIALHQHAETTSAYYSPNPLPRQPFVTTPLCQVEANIIPCDARRQMKTHTCSPRGFTLCMCCSLRSRIICTPHALQNTS